MNLQYSYSTAKRTRDFFEMIVRYINVLLLLLLLLLNVNFNRPSLKPLFLFYRCWLVQRENGCRQT